MKYADELADKGGWRKQMPVCNELDSVNITQRESVPTSNWSLIAK